MECKNTPVQLKLVSVDKDIYNEKWLWNGKLYWSIKCLLSGQKNISAKVRPSIEATDFQLLENNPSIDWDFCRNKNCNSKTDTFLLVFSFNPSSSNPKDFAQFVININVGVLYKTGNSLGNLNLNIEKVNKSKYQNFVEIWLVNEMTDSNLL